MGSWGTGIFDVRCCRPWRSQNINPLSLEIDAPEGLFQEGDPLLVLRLEAGIFRGRQLALDAGFHLHEPAADHHVVAGVGAMLGDGFERFWVLRGFQSGLNGQDHRSDLMFFAAVTGLCGRSPKSEGGEEEEREQCFHHGFSVVDGGVCLIHL
jgi:hypothetical protein